MPAQTGWRSLDIAVIGGGIGGLASAISLRRSGHKVTIYERSDFAGEVGASISCVANGSRWLHEWGVNVDKGDPVILKTLINRDWETGEPVSVYDLADYQEKWGYAGECAVHACHVDGHRPVRWRGRSGKVDCEPQMREYRFGDWTLAFENGNTAQHDFVVGADGIGSAVRSIIGIDPEKKPASSSCLHANVDTATAVKLGLVDYSKDSGIEYWGGHHTTNKIVLSPCNNENLLSYYCFFPREKGDYASHTWDSEAKLEELLSPCPDLDRQVFKHLEIGQDIRPWRLWVHQPYAYWRKGAVCILGDAAHPMMPDQSQGACMAIEDSACLGIVFSKEHFNGDLREALQVYEEVRKPRASRVQAASARARENIHERIGFSDNSGDPRYTVQDEKNKLTIEEMNSYDMYKDVADTVARHRGLPNHA